MIEIIEPGYNGLLVEPDGLRWAELLARLALAVLEVGAVVAVKDGVLGHGLREGRVDRLAITHAGLEDVVKHLLRAFFHADSAAGAELFCHQRGNGGMLDEFPFPAGAPHPEVFQGAAETGQFVTLEMGNGHKGICLDNLPADADLVQEFS